MPLGAAPHAPPHRYGEQRQGRLVGLDLEDPGLGADEPHRRGDAGLELLLDSPKPWACSSSSWSLVTTSSSVSPMRRSTCAGAGVTVVPVTVDLEALDGRRRGRLAVPAVCSGRASRHRRRCRRVPGGRRHTAGHDSQRMAPILRGPVWQSVTMSDRLTSLDASFLYLEESTTAMHVGSVMVFQPPGEGFDYDKLVQHHREPHRGHPAVPPEGPRRSRSHRQPGLGRRRGVRHELPRAARRPAPPWHRPAAAGLRRAGATAQAGPHAAPVGGLLRRGTARRPGRHRHQDAPRPHRRGQRPRHRSRHRRRRVEG